MHLWMVICRLPFLVTVTFSYDLVSRIIAPGTNLLYYFRWESKMDSFCNDRVVQTMLGHFDLNIDF